MSVDTQLDYWHLMLRGDQVREGGREGRGNECGHPVGLLAPHVEGDQVREGGRGGVMSVDTQLDYWHLMLRGDQVREGGGNECGYPVLVEGALLRGRECRGEEPGEGSFKSLLRGEEPGEGSFESLLRVGGGGGGV